VPSKILIIKTSSLGDIIHAFPAVSYLKEKFPSVKIDWVVEEPFLDLVKSNPHVSEAIAVRTKVWRKNLIKKDTFNAIKDLRTRLNQKKYDLVFDFQGNTKSGLICSLLKCPFKVGFGWKTVPEKINLFFTNLKYNPPRGNIRKNNLFLVQKFFNDIENHPSGLNPLLSLNSTQQQELQQILDIPTEKSKIKVMVCPGANWINKQLPLSTLKQLLKKIANELQCHFYFVWGNSSEQRIAVELQEYFFEDSFILPKISLPVLQHAMARMDLVISMDSLPLHLAGTTNTPTFSIFGPSSSTKYGPEGEQHHSFQGKCPYKKTFEKRCPILRTCKTGACIREAKTEEIFASFPDLKK
jgi:heptosyltransferase-1